MDGGERWRDSVPRQAEAALRLTCNYEFGVKQFGVLLQPVVVDVAGFWVHLQRAVELKKQMYLLDQHAAPHSRNMTLRYILENRKTALIQS